ARDQALVGEELADHRLELAPRLGVGEAAQVVRVDLGAEAGRRDQRERGDPARVAGGDRQDDGAAHRVAHQVGAPGTGDGEYAGDRAGQHVERAVTDVLGRRAVTRQVERVHPVARGQRFLQEQPGVPVAAVAVDEQYHVALLPGPGVADLPAADVGRLQLGR